VNIEEASSSRILPVIKEYVGAVIGRVMDEKGIPHSAKGCLEIAEKQQTVPHNQEYRLRT
jgi:hypothetical protein